MKNKFSIAMSLAVILAMLVTSVALADNVINDVVAGGNDTITSGGSTPINYRIQQTGVGNDGQAGCNASDGSPATVTINTPAGVTVDTSGAPGNQVTLTFTTCGVNQTATFTSSIPGDYIITVSVSDSGVGTYSTNQATFTLHVNAPQPPPNTAPSVSVTGVSNGAIYEAGSVPAAGCSVTDAEDGNSTFAATLSAITGPLAAYGLGSQTASCAYTDGGELSDSDSATYSIVDTTDPLITFVSRTAANGNGWNNGDVTVNWSCSDGGSGVVSAAVSQTVSTEGANQSATGTCEDHAGNTASDTQGGINIDKTAPTASASAAPASNGNGWNKTDVTVSFSGNDSLSGIASCSSPVLLSSEGAGQSASGTCTDNAGNVSALATASGINIDKTAPTSLSFVGGPAAGGSYYFGSVPAAPTCTADGAISGLASCAVTGYSAAVGPHTMTATATDNAGNQSTATQSYSVLAWTLNGFYQPVDMNGVYNTVRGGSTVPLKFEVFAGSTELTATSAVLSFVQTRIACDTSATIDEIEVTSTGGTSLRYDTTAGQFIQNWQTPRQAGACYRVTMTTQDGSFLQAFFKLK